MQIVINIGVSIATSVTLLFYKKPLMRKLAVILDGLKIEKGFVKTFKQQYLEMVICAIIPIFHFYRQDFKTGFNLVPDHHQGLRFLQSNQVNQDNQVDTSNNLGLWIAMGFFMFLMASVAAGFVVILYYH